MSEYQISAEEAGNDLLSCAAFLAENIKNRDAHAAAMQEIVPRYLAKNDVDSAAQFADAVDDPFVRDRLLTLTAEKCAALDDDEYAFQLVASIEDFGLQAQARERIALQKAVKNDFDKALRIADELDHADDAYADIAVHQAANGSESKASETIKKIDFANSKVNAFQNIALVFLEKGDKTKAVEYLELAAAAANEIEFPEEKLRALANIGNLYTEADRRDKAIETLDLSKNLAEKSAGAQTDYYLATAALGFLRAGSLDLADRALDLVKDKTQIAACLNGFAQTFWANGETTDALEALEEAYAILKSQRDAETRDSRVKFQTFAQIAAQFARFEKDERGIEIAQEIVDENEKVSALAQIAQICVQQGKEDFARQAVKAIRDDAQRMFALIGVSDAENQRNEREKAIETLNEAAALSETVPQLSVRAEADIDFTKRFQNFGETEKARSIALENLKIISQIRDETRRVALLAQLGKIFDEAEFVLNEAEKNVLRLIVQKSQL